MRVVINRSYGGFMLSHKVFEKMDVSCPGIFEKIHLERHDPKLITAIESVGLEKSSAFGGGLKIVEIPDGVEYVILDYDGIETIHEKHRVWGGE